MAVLKEEGRRIFRSFNSSGPLYILRAAQDQYKYDEM